MIEKLVLMSEMLQAQLRYPSSEASATETFADTLAEDFKDLKEYITKALSGVTANTWQINCSAISAGINRICTILYSLYASAIRSGDSPVRKAQIRFCKKLSSQIEELIWIIGVLAPGMISKNNAAPLSTYLPARLRIRSKSKALSELIPLLDEHCRPIIEIIQSAINNLLKPGKPVSFRLLEYLEELLEVLQGVKEDYPGTTINYRLHIKLITYNFNYPRYVAYCNGKLEEKFGSDSIIEKITNLSWYEMELRRIIPVPGKALFEAPMQSAQYSLQLYVTEEIKYLQLINALPSGSNVDKIRLKLSVAETSLLFLGMSELDLIEDKNFNHLTLQISRFFSTIQAESVSKESVRSNAYRYKPETIVSLIKKLLELINWLRSK
ncbi:hypothetical protein ACQKLP_10970 [Chitinophaga sp. NPDC101104]|uniref:hypothetical protein n=1 Tax=Chitinophaga sp. NPDC101104 TaxID=3390561 RepID=UPI003D0958E3